jgi:hypothetical protein
MKAVTGRTKRLIQVLEDDKIFPTGVYSVREVHDKLVATGNLLDGDMKVASVGRYLGSANRWSYNDEHNHNARYSKNGAPFPELGRRKRFPVPKAPESNDDMDRAKARSCATLQGVEQLLKAAAINNDRLSRMEAMLQQLTEEVLGARNMLKHLVDSLDGVKP